MTRPPILPRSSSGGHHPPIGHASTRTAAILRFAPSVFLPVGFPFYNGGASVGPCDSAEGTTGTEADPRSAADRGRRDLSMGTGSNVWTGLALAGDRYLIAAKLGEGGMGSVYRAHDRNIDADVVIKVPRR